ncbi:MAG: hypothetical protein ACRD16_07165 [Thermoanaerobaculia bacterium]
MKPGRLIALLVLAAAALWVWKNPGELKKLAPGGSAGSPKVPASRADADLTEAAREADKSSGAGVTENMTPEQVRALLGSPDDVESYTTDAGKPGEKWTYRQAHRMVVFENGIAVSVQPI